MGLFEGSNWFGSNEEKKRGDGAEHIAIPQGTGELAGEDQDNLDLTAQIANLNRAIDEAEREIDEKGFSTKDVNFLRDQRGILQTKLYEEKNG